MEAFENIYFIVCLLIAILSVVVLIRWWGMTSDIKEIRRLLEKQTKKDKKTVSDSVPTPSTSSSRLEIDEERVEMLKKKMKPGQCIVFVKMSSKIEIWDNTDWEDVVNKERKDRFELLHKN